jgi:carbonic anhydrase
MTQINSIKLENGIYADKFEDGNLPLPPSKKIAVVSCMDARIIVDRVLGLKIGEAHVIRNAGGIVTDDVLRSLIISHELLGTDEFIVINHTDCGMVTFNDDELRQKIQSKYNTDASTITFHSFKSIEDNVRGQVDRIRSSPFLKDVSSVTGLIYDVKTGRITEI